MTNNIFLPKNSDVKPTVSNKQLIEDICGGGSKKKTTKKPTKKTTMKSTPKKTTKKTTKKMTGGKRALPPAIVKGNAFKEHVQKDMKLKGGPVLMTFSYMIWNEFKGKNSSASVDELFKGAMNLYNEYKKKGKLEDMYKTAEKRFNEKRAQKKADKKKSE